MESKYTKEALDRFNKAFSDTWIETLKWSGSARQAFAEGMQLIYKQLQTELENLGVTPIEAVGKEFDPNFHNAVMHIEDDGLEENVITDVFQKGYKIGDRVIRPAMVKTAN